MEKEFIPYDEALALKELGFDEPCLGLYHPDGKFNIKEQNGLNCDSDKNSYLDSLGNSAGFCTAPLYQQVFRWLRETHNIDVDVVRDSEVHYQDETRWIVKVSDWNDIRVKDFPIAQLKFPNTSHHTDFKSYDEALEKGLVEALKFIKK